MSEIIPEMACNEESLSPIICTILQEITSSKLKHGSSLKQGYVGKGRAKNIA